MPKKNVNAETLTVTISFDSGTKRGFGLAGLSEEMVNRLALHGLSQKLGDSWAGKPEEAEDTVEAVWSTLSSGEWTSRAGSGQASVLVRALLALDPTLDEDDVREKVKDLEKDEKRAIEKNPAVAAKIAEIKAEDAARKLEAAKVKAAEAEPLDITSLIS